MILCWRLQRYKCSLSAISFSSNLRSVRRLPLNILFWFYLFEFILQFRQDLTFIWWLVPLSAFARLPLRRTFWRISLGSRYSQSWPILLIQLNSLIKSILLIWGSISLLDKYRILRIPFLWFFICFSIRICQCIVALGQVWAYLLAGSVTLIAHSSHVNGLIVVDLGLLLVFLDEHGWCRFTTSLRRCWLLGLISSFRRKLTLLLYGFICMHHGCLCRYFVDWFNITIKRFRKFDWKISDLIFKLSVWSSFWSLHLFWLFGIASHVYVIGHLLLQRKYIFDLGGLPVVDNSLVPMQGSGCSLLFVGSYRLGHVTRCCCKLSHAT